MAHLDRINLLTNESLALLEAKEASKSEILRFFGILVLFTRYEFGTDNI